MLVLKGLVCLHRIVNFSFFSVTGQDIDLDYHDIEWFAWKRTEIILSFLRLHPSTAFWTLVDCDGYSISSKGFLPTVVDIMVILVKFTIPVHFSLLIPKMSIFTLAISCLSASNLP